MYVHEKYSYNKHNTVLLNIFTQSFSAFALVVLFATRESAVAVARTRRLVEDSTDHIGATHSPSIIIKNIYIYIGMCLFINLNYVSGMRDSAPVWSF